MGNNVCKVNSQADTYIEECFEQKCSSYKDYNDVINQWREDKDTFSDYTSITSFDFQHYSLHDKSHSIAILRNIEMVLGQERVEALNASDLWLLLETAYCHDIGMAVDYEVLCDIWEKAEFQDFIKETMDSEISDRRKTAVFYEKLDALVHNRAEWGAVSNVFDNEEFDEAFDEVISKKSWPIILDRYIMLLYTEYIRKQHPGRSKDFMVNYDLKEQRKIPHRMYGIAAEVAWLHGENFEAIFKNVSFEENGFGAERMHPQFAAAMLRLGDLLDMDSNRFNIRVVNHIGLMPLESMLHLKKHKAITHLSFSEREIQAEARSDDIEVCKIANHWFQWLDGEVKNLICYWNKIVPSELCGCRLNCCELNILLKNQKFDAHKQTKFVADSERVYEMLIGNNIYKSRLDFIREYLQNAMDASKMKLWLKLKEDSGYTKEAIKTLTPYDIKKEWYEEYKIEIEIYVDWDKQMVEISICDHGIGMEEECVKALSNIASDSWKKRKIYAKEIPDMPLWLRPTGGFGIGVQSAFMITDCVEFITMTDHERYGRRICLENRLRGGRVSECEERGAKNGTKVLAKVRLMDFFEETMRNKDTWLKGVSGNIYDRSEVSKVVLGILYNYISDIAEFSLLPVIIKCAGEKTPETVGMKWLYAESSDAKAMEVKLNKEKRLINKAGDEWLVQYAVMEKQVFLWVPQRDLMVIYHHTSEQKAKNSCYYKGILISGETLEALGNYSIQIIYFGDNVSKYLMIDRDNFRQNYRGEFQKDIGVYKYLYAQLLADDVKMFKQCRISNEIALSTLIYYELGLINLEKEVYDGIFEIASKNISIKRIDLQALGEKCEKILRTFNAMNNSENYATVMEHLIFVQDEISVNQFILDLKSYQSIFYDAEKQDGPSMISMERFAAKMYEQKQLLDSESSSDESVIEVNMPEEVKLSITVPERQNEFIEDDLCRELVRDNRYIITDREICRIMDECAVLNGFMDIKEDRRYVMRIARANKEVSEGEIIFGGGIKEFISNNLRSELEKGEEFPIALCTSNIRNEDIKYKLWVSKVFPGIKIFFLDKDKMAYKVEKENLKYFILPMTSWLWVNIYSEIKRNRGISKEKYDEIVKHQDQLKSLIEWTYVYQDYDETKLKISEIWGQYEKVFDLLYKECISGIKSEFF